MRRRLAPILGALVVLCAAAPGAGVAGEVLEGRAIGVIDGDTIDVLVGERTARVRLAGIDTPERGQPWANRARQALAARVFGKPVRVIEVSVDRYGRLVGEVYADDVCVGCELVRDGHAWVYRKYSEDAVLLALEAEARSARRGLWGLPEADRAPPWEWREGLRAAPPPAARVAPETRAGSARPDCGSKRTCREMASCAEARAFLERCGLTRLDGDGDGVPCETLCR